jgi:hypothetical protein
MGIDAKTPTDSKQTESKSADSKPADKPPTRTRSRRRVPTLSVPDGRAAHQPGPPPQLGPTDLVINALVESIGLLTVFTGNCAVDPCAAFAAETPLLTENSSPNTALSLDGRRQTGQSVGQHVCTG